MKAYQNSGLGDCCQSQYPAFWMCFLAVMLDLILDSLKVPFVVYDISMIVFNSSILLGVVHFRKEPY